MTPSTTRRAMTPLMPLDIVGVPLTVSFFCDWISFTPSPKLSEDTSGMTELRSVAETWGVVFFHVSVHDSIGPEVVEVSVRPVVVIPSSAVVLLTGIPSSCVVLATVVDVVRVTVRVVVTSVVSVVDRSSVSVVLGPLDVVVVLSVGVVTSCSLASAGVDCVVIVVFNSPVAAGETSVAFVVSGPLVSTDVLKVASVVSVVACVVVVVVVFASPSATDAVRGDVVVVVVGFGVRCSSVVSVDAVKIMSVRGVTESVVSMG